MQRRLTKSKENYQALFNCALDAGLDQYTAGRILGFTADEYQAMLNRQVSADSKSSGLFEGSTLSQCEGDCKETLYYKDKTGRYVGNTVGGRPHGKGVLTLTNGDQFIGNFVEGNLQGNIVLRFANGNLYEGGFYRAELSGQGKFTFKDGSFDKGIFKNNRLRRGIYSDKELSFEGIFYPDGRTLMAGKSVDKISNDISESFFNAAGQKHGYRIDYFEKNRINEAIYINDKNAGPIKYTNSNGDLLIGTTAQAPYQLYGFIKSADNKMSLGALTSDGKWITLPESERENVMKIFNATNEALTKGRAEYEAAMK